MRQGKWHFDKGRKVWQPAILEEHVLREIVDRLWYQARIKVWRIRERIPGAYSRANLSTPGIPDLIGWVQLPLTLPASPHIKYVRPLFIEVKRPGGVRRESQKRFIDEASEAGCIAFFAEEWSDVVDEMSTFGIKLQDVR